MNPISAAVVPVETVPHFRNSTSVGGGYRVSFVPAKAESGTGGLAKNFLIMELFAVIMELFPVRIRN
jgi:hypothetical protein